MGRKKSSLKKTDPYHKSLNEFNKIPDPKTEQSKRILPMFQRTYELLQKYRGIAGRLWDISKATMDRLLKRLKMKCSFRNEKFTIHSLRHTFATRCAEAGIPIKQVQQWLGHTTLEMTLNVYTHINKEYEQQNAQKIDTYLYTHFAEKEEKNVE